MTCKQTQQHKPVGSEVHIQCNVAQCQGGCAEEFCPGDVATASIDKNGFRPGNKIEDGSTLAATTVFVLDPSDADRKFPFIHHFTIDWKVL